MIREGANKRLETILAMNPGVAKAAVRRRFEEAFKGRGSRIVLFGAGFLGRAAQIGFRSVGLEPVAFADNNPALHGHDCLGLPVLSPAEAAARYGESAVFVVTVFTNGPVLGQLEAMPVRHLPLSVVAWQFPEASRCWWPEFFPDGPGPWENRIRRAFALLEDEPSREEFLGQLAWRSSLDRTFLPPFLPARETYFPRGLIHLGLEETFVDCGACDGDTLRAFLKHQPAGPGLFIGIEPDGGNRRKLAAFLEGWPEGSFRIVPAVLGTESGTAFFAQSGDRTSRVQAGGELAPVQSLDDILQGTMPTLVKMDIEGSERMALEGGRRMILRCWPRLAIAAYHSPSDLWEIPLKIQELSDGYRIYLRRHSDECWEQVCYALPMN